MKFFSSHKRSSKCQKKQLTMHRNIEGLFADLVVSLCAKEIPAHIWWNAYGLEDFITCDLPKNCNWNVKSSDYGCFNDEMN